ncbi:hypothetical protein M0804_004467 [Polistes exclamans]|nr:hypothetical protein M0804_004467 [Polistes exclamans]
MVLVLGDATTTGPWNIGTNVVKMSLLKYLNNSEDVQQRGRDARADMAPGTPSCHFSHSPPPSFNEILLPKLQEEEEKEGRSKTTTTTPTTTTTTTTTPTTTLLLVPGATLTSLCSEHTE